MLAYSEDMEKIINTKEGVMTSKIKMNFIDRVVISDVQWVS